MDSSYGNKLAAYLGLQLLLLIGGIVVLVIIVNYIWTWIFNHISIAIK